MRRFLIGFVFLLPILSLSQTIRKVNGQYEFYRFGNSKVNSDYDSVYSVDGNWFTAIKSNSDVDLFYHDYRMKGYAEIVDNRDLTHFWKYWDLIHGSNSIGEVFYNATGSWKKYDDYTGAVIVKSKSQLRYGVFLNKKNITGFKYNKIQKIKFPSQEDVYACSSDEGIEFYSLSGKKIYPEAANHYEVYGNKHHDGTKRVIVWLKDDKYGMFSPDKSVYISPRKFFKPFHSIYSKFSHLKNLDYSNQGTWRKLLWAGDGYEKDYFPFDRWAELPYYPIQEEGSDKVGLVNTKDSLVLEFEYDEIYVYKTPVEKSQEVFLIVKKNGSYSLLDENLKKIKDLDFDNWISFGYAYSYSTFDPRAIVKKGDKYFYWDVRTKDWNERDVSKENGVRAVLNMDGEMAMFTDECKMIIPFDNKMLYDDFGYIFPKFEKDLVKFYNSNNELVYPEGVKAIIPSYSKGIYLTIKDKSAGLFSLSDLSHIPLSKDFYEENDFVIDGGAANRRLDVGFRIKKDGKYGVINYRNDTLLQPKYDSVRIEWFYKNVKSKSELNPDQINAFGWRNGEVHIVNSKLDKTKQIKKGEPVFMTANEVGFIDKGKFTVYGRKELKKIKNFDFGQGEDRAIELIDYGDTRRAGLVNSKGDIVIPITFCDPWLRTTDYDEFSYYNVRVLKDDKVFEGLFLKNGTEILPVEYKSIYEADFKGFFNYCFTVKNAEGLYGIIKIDPNSKSFKWLVEPLLEDYKKNRSAGTITLNYKNGKTAYLYPDEQIHDK